MKRIEILVVGLLLTLTSCGIVNKQVLATVLPLLTAHDYNGAKHTVSCNSLAPLALISHYYNDDTIAVAKFVDELEKTYVQDYAKLPESQNVACPTINTYVLTNEEVEFTFDVTNMFVFKNERYYEIETLPTFPTLYVTKSFSQSTIVVEIRDDNHHLVTNTPLDLRGLEFKESTLINQSSVKFTIETGGGIISVYDRVTFGLNVGEQTERFYEVISEETFASLFDANNNFTDETMLLANIPQQLNFRNQKYKMITSSFFEWQDIELDILIAYFVNARDYAAFYLENPDVEYCIDETNTLYYIDGPSKFPLYSLVGHPSEQLIALTLPKGEGSPMFFRNISSV